MVNGFNKELKDLLEHKFNLYNSTNFIIEDPISIPHTYNQKEDIEIISFLISIISWGNRKSIIKSGSKLREILGSSPIDFIMRFKQRDLKKIDFVHRTFNKFDLIYFLKSLKNIYENHDGLENVFSKNLNDEFMYNNISNFRKIFFSLNHEKRTEKHISNPKKNSACKRINMFLRWMVRNDGIVDFGIWKKIKPSMLSCPLDVHTANIGRKLNLISRKQNDLKTVLELDKKLRLFDKNDPVKYDYALFGMGVYEKF
ncbi:MAG: TIGR02757 family protein [Flavobacteriaceae bacterium]|nr:TIGR02757 family protein [Flavobacteriaceae bacterium]